MQFTDLSIATRYLSYAEVTAWQQTREIIFSILGPYLKNKSLTSKDIIPLPTDAELNKGHTTEITNEEIEFYNRFKKQYEERKKERS